MNAAYGINDFGIPWNYNLLLKLPLLAPKKFLDTKPYLFGSCKAGPEGLAHLEPSDYPLGELSGYGGSLVPQVGQHDEGVVPGVTDGTTNRLVHCFHAQALIVNLSWETSIGLARLERGGAKEMSGRGTVNIKSMPIPASLWIPFGEGSQHTS